MFLETPENREIDAVLAAYRAPGILLHRPYPPMHSSRGRSRLGGLPNLPEDVEWPCAHINEKQVPLHFLVQIDCAELPQFDDRLPSAGMLFFFARDDEEQVWGYEGEPHDDGRVIFAPHVAADAPVRAAPLNLPPIRERFAGFDPVMPDEPGPAVHFSWPLVALRFDTWPDASALNREYGEAYDRRVAMLRAASVVAATGLPTLSEKRPDWEEDLFPSKPFRLPQVPPVAVMIDRIARQIVAWVLVLSRTSGTASPEATELILEARQWIKRASEIGLDQAVSADDMRAFEAWLEGLSRVDDLDPVPRIDGGPAFRAWHNSRSVRTKVRWNLPRMFTGAIKASITYLGGSAANAALVPDHLYEAMENHFLPFDQRKCEAYAGNRTGGWFWCLEARVHQMLGHAPATQQAMPVDSDAICLLQLATDDGVELTFGDVGEAAYWIKSDDLIERRFDKAWLTLQCH